MGITLNFFLTAGICYIVYIPSVVLVLVVRFPSEISQKRDFHATKYLTSSDRNNKIELPYTINCTEVFTITLYISIIIMKYFFKWSLQYPISNKRCTKWVRLLDDNYRWNKSYSKAILEYRDRHIDFDNLKTVHTISSLYQNMQQQKQPKNAVIKSTFTARFPSQSYRVQMTKIH